MALIVIDPGHGGHDSGAVGSRSKEKDNVLNVAKRLKTLLEKHGHDVSLTRSTDKFISLSGRASFANQLGADYFVSLHNNSAANKSATGFETFIYNGSVSSKTREFQKYVHDEIANNIGIRDRGKKRANFAVLRLTNMVAILIEYAFISNKNDEDILINQVDELAQWTCNGIVRALGGTVKDPVKSPPKEQPTPAPELEPVLRPAPQPQPKPPQNKQPSGNANIKKFQQWLNSQYNGGLVVDGIYGPRTKKAAIKGFQTELNKQFNADLQVDGIWGPKTKAATVNVYKGAKGNLTKNIQGMLFSKGYDPKYLDGVFGNATANAVLAFQRDNGLTRDGIVGKKTFEKLFA